MKDKLNLSILIIVNIIYIYLIRIDPESETDFIIYILFSIGMYIFSKQRDIDNISKKIFQNYIYALLFITSEILMIYLYEFFNIIIFKYLYYIAHIFFVFFFFIILYYVIKKLYYEFREALNKALH